MAEIRVLLIALLMSPVLFAQSGPKSPATVNQLMRGILFINANVVFSAQSDNPAEVKPDAQGSRAVNALAGVFGGWEAIENAGLALSESATLLALPRSCANGKPAPLQDPEWQKFVGELRDIGMVAYKAGKAKSQEQILDVSDQMTQACSHCHAMYRDKSRESNAASRCTK